MRIFHRKPPARQREPHPDPATEARLQRIIALRESGARKAALAAQYADEIAELSRAYREWQDNYRFVQAANAQSRLKALQQDIRQLEAEISAVYTAIAEHTAEISSTDLSYL